MSLFHRLLSTFKQNNDQPAESDAVQQFKERVDFLTEYFGWDPSLPEFQELKDDASSFVGYNNGMHRLQELNPLHSACKLDDGSHIIFERFLGGVMRAEHIAEQLCKGLANIAHEICADKNGLRICNRFGGLLVTFQAASINPNRLGDTGERYRNAAYLIKRYTGLDTLEEHKMIGRVRAITVLRKDDGTWHQPEHEYAPGREPVAK